MTKDPLTRRTGTSTAIEAATEAVNYRHGMDLFIDLHPYREHYEVAATENPRATQPINRIGRKALAETNTPRRQAIADRIQTKHGYGHGSR